MSTLEVDSIVASTFGADLNLDGAGTGVVNLATGAKLNGTALTSTFNPYVAPGTSGNLLTSNGSAWTSAAPAAGGGMTLLSTTSLSGATTTISGISQDYVNLYVVIYGKNAKIFVVDMRKRISLVIKK